jgi:hypothetical protein
MARPWLKGARILGNAEYLGVGQSSNLTDRVEVSEPQSGDGTQFLAHDALPPLGDWLIGVAPACRSQGPAAARLRDFAVGDRFPSRIPFVGERGRECCR